MHADALQVSQAPTARQELIYVPANLARITVYVTTFLWVLTLVLVHVALADPIVHSKCLSAH